MKTKNPKLLWIPKLPQLSKQCVSCPFLKGNDVEFGKIVQGLRSKFKLGHASDADVLFARYSLRLEIKNSGDFVCHGTAYDENMNLRDHLENRQCPGATAYFISQQTQ